MARIILRRMTVLIIDDRRDDDILTPTICELRQPTITPPELFILMLWV